MRKFLHTRMTRKFFDFASVRSMIGLKIRANYSTNRIQDQNQVQFSQCFPSLGAGHVYIRQVLIVIADDVDDGCFGLDFTNENLTPHACLPRTRHARKEDSTQRSKTTWA